MASGGSFSNSIVSGHYKLKVDWSQAQDVSANTSTVTCKMYLINDWSLGIGSRANTCTVGGTAKSFTSPAISGTDTHALGTVSQSVSHSSDGTKSIMISAVFKIQATLSGTYYEQIAAGATVTLNTIPRASSVSGKAAVMGQESTVTVTRASSSFTHTLKYSFGSVTKTFATKTGAVSVAWTPPLSLASQVPDAVSGTCTITCVTYSGDTKIGTKTCTLKLSVPASVKPSIGSLAAERIDGTVPPSWGIYVQSKSKAKLTVNGAAGIYGSSIVSYSISGGGFSSNASGFTTGYLNSYGSITFTATVTDSRGRVSAAASVTVTVEQYFVPYFESYSLQRCLYGGALSDDGTCGLADAGYSHAACGGRNSASCAVHYKKSPDSIWTDAGVALSSGIPAVFGAGWISTEYSYDIRLTLTDAFHTVSVTDTIPTAAVVMDFRRGGRGVAVGKVSETDACFEVSENWDVKVYGKLLKDYISSIAGSMYPVGSIYMSVIPTNPSAYFGGTWTSWGTGRVPVGVDASDTDFATAEKTGGASTVTLTAKQMPAHTHAKGTLAADSGGAHKHKLNLTKTAWGASSGNKVVVDSTDYTAMDNRNTASGGAHEHTISGATASAGSGNAHSNLQPYITCYMWKRIS